MLPTLAGFIRTVKEQKGWRNNAYVDEPGWEHLYVRYGRRVIADEIREPVIDIANLEAKEPGKGTFKGLVEQIRKDYPECYIYVENVLVPQFREGLRKMGFIETSVGLGDASSFYLRPAKES
jgi:hypothetical protein